MKKKKNKDLDLKWAGVEVLNKDPKSTKNLTKKLVDGEFSNYFSTELDDNILFYVPGSLLIEPTSDGLFVRLVVSWVEKGTNNKLIEICEANVPLNGTMIIEAENIVWPFILKGDNV